MRSSAVIGKFGPYLVETYLADGRKNGDPPITIEGELLALASIAGKPAWIVRRGDKVTTSTGVDLSYLGAFRQVWLESDGSVVYVAERLAGKAQRRRLFAGVAAPDGKVRRERPLGEVAELTTRGRPRSSSRCTVGGTSSAGRASRRRTMPRCSPRCRAATTR